MFALLFAIEQGDISANLQEVVVPILSNSECRKTGYGSSRITDNMLCAGFKDGEKDSCQVFDDSIRIRVFKHFPTDLFIEWYIS